jgi:hypothetical protein
MEGDANPADAYILPFSSEPIVATSPIDIVPPRYIEFHRLLSEPKL